MGDVRKFFAGGITALGFYSFFDQIIDDQAALRIILKGGPGTGKSTLMKKIGSEIAALGYDLEEFYCSSDADSLDAIMIPAVNATVIDGTAPHIVDPVYPGCVDEIVDLGRFWDRNKLVARRSEIINLIDQNKACYPHVYRYLQAAKALYDHNCELNKSWTDWVQVNSVTKNLIAEILPKQNNPGLGKIRHLFASAFTPQGPVNHLPCIMQTAAKQYIIKGEPGTGKEVINQSIIQEAVRRGYYIEAYHCSLVPTKIDHLFIPLLNIAVITSYPPHIYENESAETINLNDYMNHYKRLEHQYTLHKNFVLFEELSALALGQLKKAKAIHDDLELIYVRHMDFGRYEALQQEIISKITALPEGE